MSSSWWQWTFLPAKRFPLSLQYPTLSYKMDKKNRTTTEEKDKKGYKEPPIDISCTSYTLYIQNIFKTKGNAAVNQSSSTISYAFSRIVRCHNCRLIYICRKISKLVNNCSKISELANFGFHYVKTGTDHTHPHSIKQKQSKSIFMFFFFFCLFFLNFFYEKWLYWIEKQTTNKDKLPPYIYVMHNMQV